VDTDENDTGPTVVACGGHRRDADAASGSSPSLGVDRKSLGRHAPAPFGLMTGLYRSGGTRWHPARPAVRTVSLPLP
jgi:hypothetical protein